MRRSLTLMLPALLATAPACRRQAAGPAWVRTVPAHTVATVSCQLSWFMENRQVQDLLSAAPMAEQTLDLFLQKARIDPKSETGRLALHLLKMPSFSTKNGGGMQVKEVGSFLLQLDQVRDPAALKAAVGEAFPAEGSLRIAGKDCPLYVIMDLEQGEMKAHLRAAVDETGGLWIGELSALTQLASSPTLDSRPDIRRAAEWISPRASFQGFFRAEALARTLQANLPENLGGPNLDGLEGLFWSATLPKEPGAPIRFELSLGGRPEAVGAVFPWIQRLGAAAEAARNSQASPAEVLKEDRRVGLRCSLAPDQFRTFAEKLGLPTVSFDPAKPASGSAPRKSKP